MFSRDSIRGFQRQFPDGSPTGRTVAMRCWTCVALMVGWAGVAPAAEPAASPAAPVSAARWAVRLVGLAAFLLAARLGWRARSPRPVPEPGASA